MPSTRLTKTTLQTRIYLQFVANRVVVNLAFLFQIRKILERFPYFEFLIRNVCLKNDNRFQLLRKYVKRAEKKKIMPTTNNCTFRWLRPKDDCLYFVISFLFLFNQNDTVSNCEMNFFNESNLPPIFSWWVTSSFRTYHNFVHSMLHVTDASEWAKQLRLLTSSIDKIIPCFSWDGIDCSLSISCRRKANLFSKSCE